MSLRFEHSFVVKSAPDKVWAYLTDPYRVAPALPGASITEKVDAETYNGGITIKVGPVSARYKGTVRFEAMDPAARTAAIVATGQDTSGRGGADMRMQSRLTEKVPGETEVNMVSEVNVTGIMAQFGRIELRRWQLEYRQMYGSPTLFGGNFPFESVQLTAEELSALDHPPISEPDEIGASGFGRRGCCQPDEVARRLDCGLLPGPLGPQVPGGGWSVIFLVVSNEADPWQPLDHFYERLDLLVFRQNPWLTCGGGCYLEMSDERD